ncbi:hypothetical protein CALVIDRAFT_533166 [Calocera viscosa TUFC12733]|uniref:Uncharacterized protein n=1 Tax=Calocera viscosa (strain TUFC12733) TaxID=1330018 RepID=A0A167REN6_CALVF|nr:hypothetical protein CALVIDRAFT_533166 [Calocera viscosa TUFC12733]
MQLLEMLRPRPLLPLLAPAALSALPAPLPLPIRITLRITIKPARRGPSSVSKMMRVERRVGPAGARVGPPIQGVVVPCLSRHT